MMTESTAQGSKLSLALHAKAAGQKEFYAKVNIDM